MNGNQLIPGHDYAYVNYPRRQPGIFYPHAKCVKVIRVLSVEVPGYSKRRTYVEVEFAGVNGSEPYMRTVRARQIVYQWNEQKEGLERERIKEERRQAEYERVNAEYRRREEERAQKIRDANEPIYKLFESVGIHRQDVAITMYNVSINRSVIQAVLNENVV